MSTEKYQVKDEFGKVLCSVPTLKEFREFWNKPTSQNYTIVQEFGRKGVYLIQIVREI